MQTSIRIRKPARGLYTALSGASKIVAKQAPQNASLGRPASHTRTFSLAHIACHAADLSEAVGEITAPPIQCCLPSM